MSQWKLPFTGQRILSLLLVTTTLKRHQFKNKEMENCFLTYTSFRLIRYVDVTEN